MFVFTMSFVTHKSEGFSKFTDDKKLKEHWLKVNKKLGKTWIPYVCCNKLTLRWKKIYVLMIIHSVPLVRYEGCLNSYCKREICHFLRILDHIASRKYVGCSMTLCVQQICKQEYFNQAVRCISSTYGDYQLH